MLKTLVGYDSKNPGEMFDEEAVSNYLTNFNRDVPTPSWSMHGAKSVDGSRFEYDRDG